MPISLSNEGKNSLAITNEQRGSNSITWDEATFTWDEAAELNPGTWDNVSFPITKESKNSVSISNESKNA